MTDHDPGRDPLDPREGPARWERAVASIMDAAGSELARRSAERGAVQVLEDWARPVFALAASIVLVASAALLQTATTDPEVASTEDGLNTVAEAFVGSELAAWIESGYSLSADELVTAIDAM